MTQLSDYLAAFDHISTVTPMTIGINGKTYAEEAIEEQDAIEARGGPRYFFFNDLFNDLDIPF